MPTTRGSKPLMKPCALALVFGAAAVGRVAVAQDAGESVVLDAPSERDQYLAGGTVEVSADVAGDVVAAGGTVETTAAVAEDLAAAGGTVRVRGRVGDDVRAVGGRVTLSGEVGDAAVLAGGVVRVARGAKVGGLALLAAGEVVVDGELAGELRAVGGTVRIGGSVAGDAHVEARDRLVLAPGARIGGDLVYSSPKPAVLPQGATVAGRVVHRPVKPSPDVFPAVAALGAILWIVGLALAAVIFLVAFPRLAVGAARLVGSAPGRAVAAGTIHLFLVPIASIAALLTGVGAPLALAVLGIWLLTLFAGWLVAAIFLADLVARRIAGAEPRTGVRAGLTALAVAALALVGAIPVVGWLVSLAALLFGTGALLLALGRALRLGPPLAAPAPTAAAG